MKTYRIELRYVGIVFVEADGVMESQFSITFHRNGTAVASYPSYAVNTYEEGAMQTRSDRWGHGRLTLAD